MKKGIVIIAAVMLLIATVFPTTVLADTPGESGSGDIQTVVYNEYAQIQKLQAMQDSELIQLGFTEIQIQGIRDFNYPAALEERANLPQTELATMGYSPSEIVQLKSYDGNSLQAYSLGATLTLTIDKGTLSNGRYIYNSSSNRTYWQNNYKWSWSSTPAMMFTDTVGAGWAPTMSLYASSSTVYYKNYQSGSSAGTVDSSFALKGTNSAKSGNFDVADYYIKGRYNWAYKGSGYIKVTAAGKKRDLQMNIAYGHSTWVATPSISAPLGVGFSFSTNVEKIGQTVQYYY